MLSDLELCDELRGPRQPTRAAASGVVEPPDPPAPPASEVVEPPDPPAPPASEVVEPPASEVVEVVEPPATMWALDGESSPAF